MNGTFSAEKSQPKTSFRKPISEGGGSRRANQSAPSPEPTATEPRRKNRTQSGYNSWRRGATDTRPTPGLTGLLLPESPEATRAPSAIWRVEETGTETDTRPNPPTAQPFPELPVPTGAKYNGAGESLKWQRDRLRAGGTNATNERRPRTAAKTLPGTNPWKGNRQHHSEPRPDKVRTGSRNGIAEAE